MAAISLTYTLTNGATADASQVMQNFNDIVNGTSDGTKDFSINALTLAGALTANGNVTIGNASGDDLTINASLASSVPIKTTASYDIGSSTLGLRALYFGANSQTVNIQGSSSMSATWTLTLPTTAGTSGYALTTNGSGTTSWTDTATSTQEFQNKSFLDSNCQFVDNGDTTKKLQFQASGITTGTTRVLTAPDFDGTIATLAGTETLTNKDISAASITYREADSDTSGIVTTSDQEFGGRKSAGNSKVRAYRSSTGYSISNGSYTAIVFEAESFDTNTEYNSTTGVFTPARTGYYLVTATVKFTSAFTGNIAIFKAGSRYQDIEYTASSVSALHITGVLACTATTDTIDIRCFNNSGANREVANGTDISYLEIVELL